MTNALLQQGMISHKEGRFAEAEKCYRSLLDDPLAKTDRPDAMALLACVVSSLGRADEAVCLIMEAVELDPKAALFRFYLGTICLEHNRPAEAVEAFEQAIALQPSMASAFYNLGNALRLTDKWDEAASAYAQALVLEPAYAEAANNLALVAEHAGDTIEAQAVLVETTARYPTYLEAWLNLCRVAEKNGDLPMALAAGQTAMKLAPSNSSAYLGQAVALNRMERHEEALALYHKALELKPNWIEVWDNLGQTFQFLNRLEEADEAYRQTIVLANQVIADEDTRQVSEKEYGNRHWHLALLELLRGDYKHGFARYRARFEDLGVHRPAYTQPVWQGEDLQGKTILVGDEQGMGDCLMMARYLPLLRAKGAHVKFLVHPMLYPLFEGWKGAQQLFARGQEVGSFDYHASIFDLPYGFGSTLETIPSQCPYLPLLWPTADHLLPESPLRKIGVVWGGAPKHKHDARRSVPLARFSKLFSIRGVSYFNLNRDKREGDDVILASFPDVVDLVPRLNDFADLARFVGQMDLIVTCDTATAHLAGGMGKDVWTLLPFAPDWRWLAEGETSAWYPSMRLFRQKKIGDWDEVIARVIRQIG